MDVAQMKTIWTSFSEDRLQYDLAEHGHSLPVHPSYPEPNLWALQQFTIGTDKSCKEESGTADKLQIFIFSLSHSNFLITTLGNWKKKFQ